MQYQPNTHPVSPLSRWGRGGQADEHRGRDGSILYLLTSLWAGMSREGEIYKDIGLTAGVGGVGGGGRLELTLVRMFHEINSDIVTFHKKTVHNQCFLKIKC